MLVIDDDLVLKHKDAVEGADKESQQQQHKPHPWFKLFRLFVRSQSRHSKSFTFSAIVMEHLQLSCLAFIATVLISEKNE